MSLHSIKRVSLFFLSVFYLIAGINHFVNPAFYYPLIPPYLEFPFAINLISGIVEILLAIGFIYKRTRTFAAYSTVLMLLAFIPSHIYFIQIGGCVPDGLCVSETIAWLRLLVIHPLLIIWAFWHKN